MLKLISLPFAAVVLVSAAAAQDLPLVDLERERLPKVLEARLADAKSRVELLERALKLSRTLPKLEAELEGAEDKDDEAAVERIEELMERQEFALEMTLVRLDLLAQKQRVRALVAEMRQEELNELVREGERLIAFQDRRERSIAKFVEHVRNDEEEAAEELEAQFESMEERFGLRLELLRVRFALHWAREEQDEEAIEEVTEEIETLQQELKELTGEEEPRSPREDDKQVSGAEAKLPLPIAVTDVEVAEAAKLSLNESITPLLRKYCYECHDAKSASGDLNFEMLVERQPLVVHRKQWLNVRQQVAVRSMPPVDEPQPSDDERRRLVAFLKQAIDRFDYTTVASPGYEPARRLTHAEYNHAVRDLFGVDLRPADRFPADLTATSGFENSANSLFLQPILMERYIDAAESIVDAAFPLRPTTAAHRDVRQRVLGGADPRDALLRFAARAYRRRLSEDESDRLLNLFDKSRTDGATADEALRSVLQTVLISPAFLLRTEDDRSGDAKRAFRVSDYELASRLSFFLWASIPDERLARLAESGRLSRPDVLSTEVDRLLKDDKARTLGEIFAAQWLGFANLDRVQRDQIENPWATDSLVEAMATETSLLFHSLVKENAQIERLLDADYTFVNEELARHYGIRGVTGKAPKRISVAELDRRGVLGHGSILAITSFPRRTSPVVRGNWILTHLLGTPPPPPPPNVSQFDERVAENRRLTQKEKLKLHRRNPNCYSCHSQIDPLGFAMEQYDWFGRHRPLQRGKKIDAVGQLPSGREVVGAGGLRRALIEERRDDLVQQIARRMMAYALGRQLEYYDEAGLRSIVAEVEKNDRRLHALVKSIVFSDAFQMKQLPKE